jgi:hypothetical protein
MFKNIFTPKLNGYLASNSIAMVILGLTKLLMQTNGQPIFIFSEFVIVPILMGIVSAWFWSVLNLSSRQAMMYSFYNSLIAIALSFVFLGEGSICLIIVSPLIFCFVITGVCKLYSHAAACVYSRCPLNA